MIALHAFLIYGRLNRRAGAIIIGAALGLAVG
jgi:hypothetical protein